MYRKAILSYFFIILRQTELVERPILARSEISGLLVNTFTVGGEHFRYIREKLSLPLQMQLSKKAKRFWCYIIAFLEPTLNFEDFQKKKIIKNYYIPEIIDSERRSFLSLKLLFHKNFNRNC